MALLLAYFCRECLSTRKIPLPVSSY
uniref:Uncharacterized protein n=1 Tax=Arundo donax TaxID=35708 RepID=A0A0A9BP32_ARUDO